MNRFTSGCVAPLCLALADSGDEASAAGRQMHKNGSRFCAPVPINTLRSAGTSGINVCVCLARPTGRDESRNGQAKKHAGYISLLLCLSGPT